MALSTMPRCLWPRTRNERRTWARHKARLEFGVGCVVVPFTEQDAHEAGRLLAVTRTAVVTVAWRNNAVIVTGDPEDMERLVRPSRRKGVLLLSEHRWPVTVWEKSFSGLE